jgi:hypothetical protein
MLPIPQRLPSYAQKPGMAVIQISPRPQSPPTSHYSASSLLVEESKTGRSSSVPVCEHPYRVRRPDQSPSLCRTASANHEHSRHRPADMPIVSAGKTHASFTMSDPPAYVTAAVTKTRPTPSTRELLDNFVLPTFVVSNDHTERHSSGPESTHKALMWRITSLEAIRKSEGSDHGEERWSW